MPDEWMTELAIGNEIVFSKTISELDVVMFAALTGDMHPVHTDEHRMKQSPFGGRLVHGVFVLGLLSTAASLLTGHLRSPAISLGYESVRFLKPTLIGDTLHARYRIESHEADMRRVVSAGEVANQRGDVVLQARHKLKVVAEAGW